MDDQLHLRSFRFSIDVLAGIPQHVGKGPGQRGFADAVNRRIHVSDGTAQLASDIDHVCHHKVAHTFQGSAG